jgi:hypothetical protein
MLVSFASLWMHRSTLGAFSCHTHADFVATLAVGRRPGTPGAAKPDMSGRAT